MLRKPVILPSYLCILQQGDFHRPFLAYQTFAIHYQLLSHGSPPDNHDEDEFYDTHENHHDISYPTFPFSSLLSTSFQETYDVCMVNLSSPSSAWSQVASAKSGTVIIETQKCSGRKVRRGGVKDERSDDNDIYYSPISSFVSLLSTALLLPPRPGKDESPPFPLCNHQLLLRLLHRPRLQHVPPSLRVGQEPLRRSHPRRVPRGPV